MKTSLLTIFLGLLLTTHAPSPAAGAQSVSDQALASALADELTSDADEHADEHAGEEEGEHAEAGGGHEGHEGEEEGEGLIRLTGSQMKEFGIKLVTVQGGALSQFIEMPAEIRLNTDRVAHVVPRVSGLVRNVKKSLGDRVKTGETMATLESRELADSTVAYLAAIARLDLARSSFEREEKLWQKRITSELEYLDARQSFAEARIEINSAEQKMHALGFSDEYLKDLPLQPDANFTRYKLNAPFDGTVIERHITLGESLNDDSLAFVIADLSSVWADISVYQKDLPNVRKGQRVLLSDAQGQMEAEGTISYVGPIVGESTRAGLARVVLNNPSSQWRPGMFVTAKIAIAEKNVPTLISRKALQTLGDETVVFVQTPEGFEPKFVKTGKLGSLEVEILSGLSLGDRYVSAGSFTLKAQLSKGSFGDGHNH